MSDDLAAELRRVYADAYDSMGSIAEAHDAALLAVARHSAERQRGMGATQEMVRAAYAGQPNAINGGFAQAHREMQSAAPLWVDKK